MIASLNHPVICQLYDVGPNYVVMGLVDSAPLKGLSVGKAIEYARQILDALDAAHRKGVTHTAASVIAAVLRETARAEASNLLPMVVDCSLGKTLSY